MLINPKTYSQAIRGENISQLKRERNRLINEIREFDKAMDDDNIVMVCNPDPETIYLCNHLYLAEVCKLIGERLSDSYTNDSY